MTATEAIGPVLPTEPREEAKPQVDTGPLIPSAALSPYTAVNVMAVLAVFLVLYFAASLLIPVAMAVLFSMMLAPIVQLLEMLRLPRAVASAIVVLSTMILLAICVIALAGPAKTWIEKAPASIKIVQHKLQGFTKTFDDIKRATDELQDQNDTIRTRGPQEVRVVRPAFSDILLLGSSQAISSGLSVFILLFFLLSSGDVFLRKLVTVIPTLSDKKRAVDITRQIEADISFYLLSFLLVNVGLGVAMTIVTALLGIPNPILWGCVVTILNFVPYVGAFSSIVILAMVGVQTFDGLMMALAAPAILLLLVAIVAEVITPAVLGRRLLLNPVAIFFSIMLWGFLWGIVGVLLAVPLLASFKIICERVEPLHGVAEFLTT